MTSIGGDASRTPMRIESTTKFSEEQERLHREIEERQASLEALATRKSEVEAHKASLPGEQLQAQARGDPQEPGR